MEAFLVRAEGLLWGWPLLLLLLGSGLWLLVRLRFLPLRELPRALGLVFRRSGDRGGVTAFGSLCMALSATIGTGNIVGVATALRLGGPGALLWMELSALTGLSLKYAEGLLARRYRFRNPDGSHRGGPFAYISLGLGKRGRPLALAFALCGALAGLCGVGTFVQVGSLSACLSLSAASVPGAAALSLSGGGVTLLRLGVGLALALLAARVIFGGMERISRLSALLVPLMGGLYLFCCVWVLIRCRAALPEVLGRVLRTAFRPEAPGAGLLAAVMAGVSRGVFSNEAGLGTAPIAAAAAEGVSPREQGLLSMTATVFDTLLICTLTGLVLLATGAEGLGVGAAMTAFARGLPLPELLSKGLVCWILALFAFTTAVGWSCYGTACLDYLTGGSARLRRAYLLLYVCTVALAPLCSARGVWAAAGICNGLMAIPNVTALLLLGDRVSESSALP